MNQTQTTNQREIEGFVRLYIYFCGMVMAWVFLTYFTTELITDIEFLILILLFLIFSMIFIGLVRKKGNSTILKKLFYITDATLVILALLFLFWWQL